MQLLSAIDPNFIKGKRVLVRADLDVDIASLEDAHRLQAVVPTLKYLLNQGCGVVLIGHKGRPEGKPDSELTLAPLAQKIGDLINKKIEFVNQVLGTEVNKKADNLKNGEIILLENIRFVAGEEENDEGFAGQLASYGKYYVNEAFGVSHRKHASIVTLPKLLPHAAGLRLTEEITNLDRIFDNPKRPVIMIISGVKEDKLSGIEKFFAYADKILLGGRLPEYIETSGKYSTLNDQLIVARLMPDKEDITIHSMEAFEKEISLAGTIVLSGPVGKFEEEGHRQGTDRVFNAVAGSSAFKVAGGGDTEKALNLLHLSDKFDWISVGGGAMLEFLANKTLPGIEALQ